MLNNSTTGSYTTSGDKRSDRAHPSDEILSGRFNSGRVFKTSGVICQVCKNWFRSRFDLATHQRLICVPATKTLGFQNLYQPPSRDMARLTNLPIIPRHPTLFQKANVLRHNPALTPCNMDNSVAQRYSVPGETRHLQPNMTRHYPGPPPLYGSREANIPLSSIISQDRSTHDTNQDAGEGILPGDRQLLEAVKKAAYARKDPESVCIHCEVNFKTRANKEKHSMRCSSDTQTLKASRATKEYICPKCSKFYHSKQALIDHAERCKDTMCRTSPLGLIDKMAKRRR